MTDFGVLRINDTISCKLNERPVIIDNQLKKNDGNKHNFHYRTSLCKSFPPYKFTSYTKTNPEIEHRYHE